MPNTNDKLTHIETEKPDESGVWHLISMRGGRDKNGELKIKKVIRETADLRTRTTSKRKGIKLTR